VPCHANRVWMPPTSAGSRAIRTTGRAAGWCGLSDQPEQRQPAVGVTGRSCPRRGHAAAQRSSLAAKPPHRSQRVRSEIGPDAHDAAARTRTGREGGLGTAAFPVIRPAAPAGKVGPAALQAKDRVRVLYYDVHNSAHRSRPCLRP
jgi:hypothetical protein